MYIIHFSAIAIYLMTLIGLLSESIVYCHYNCVIEKSAIPHHAVCVNCRTDPNVSVLTGSGKKTAVYNIKDNTDCDTLVNTTLNKYVSIASGDIPSTTAPRDTGSGVSRSAEVTFSAWDNTTTKVFGNRSAANMDLTCIGSNQSMMQGNQGIGVDQDVSSNRDCTMYFGSDDNMTDAMEFTQCLNRDVTLRVQDSAPKLDTSQFLQRYMSLKRDDCHAGGSEDDNSANTFSQAQHPLQDKTVSSMADDAPSTTNSDASAQHMNKTAIFGSDSNDMEFTTALNMINPSYANASSDAKKMVASSEKTVVFGSGSDEMDLTRLDQSIDVSISSSRKTLQTTNRTRVFDSNEENMDFTTGVAQAKTNPGLPAVGTGSNDMEFTMVVSEANKSLSSASTKPAVSANKTVLDSTNMELTLVHGSGTIGTASIQATQGSHFDAIPDTNIISTAGKSQCSDRTANFDADVNDMELTAGMGNTSMSRNSDFLSRSVFDNLATEKKLASTIDGIGGNAGKEQSLNVTDNNEKMPQTCPSEGISQESSTARDIGETCNEAATADTLDARLLLSSHDRSELCNADPNDMDWTDIVHFTKSPHSVSFGGKSEAMLEKENICRLPAVRSTERMAKFGSGSDVEFSAVVADISYPGEPLSEVSEATTTKKVDPTEKTVIFPSGGATMEYTNVIQELEPTRKSGRKSGARKSVGFSEVTTVFGDGGANMDLTSVSTMPSVESIPSAYSDNSSIPAVVPNISFPGKPQSGFSGATNADLTEKTMIFPSGGETMECTNIVQGSDPVRKSDAQKSVGFSEVTTVFNDCGADMDLTAAAIAPSEPTDDSVHIDPEDLGNPGNTAEVQSGTVTTVASESIKPSENLTSNTAQVSNLLCEPDTEVISNHRESYGIQKSIQIPGHPIGLVDPDHADGREQNISSNISQLDSSEQAVTDSDSNENNLQISELEDPRASRSRIESVPDDLNMTQVAGGVEAILSILDETEKMDTSVGSQRSILNARKSSGEKSLLESYRSFNESRSQSHRERNYSNISNRTVNISRCQPEKKGAEDLVDVPIYTVSPTTDRLHVNNSALPILITSSGSGDEEVVTSHTLEDLASSPAQLSPSSIPRNRSMDTEEPETNNPLKRLKQKLRRLSVVKPASPALSQSDTPGKDFKLSLQLT